MKVRSLAFPFAPVPTTTVCSTLFRSCSYPCSWRDVVDVICHLCFAFSLETFEGSMSRISTCNTCVVSGKSQSCVSTHRSDCRSLPKLVPLTLLRARANCVALPVIASCVCRELTSSLIESQSSRPSTRATHANPLFQARLRMFLRHRIIICLLHPRHQWFWKRVGNNFDENGQFQCFSHFSTILHLQPANRWVVGGP